MKEQIVAMAIRMTGIMAVSTEMAKPGGLFLLEFFEITEYCDVDVCAI